MATGSYLSVITLNINGLNALTKRQRLAEWIQKQDPYICCLQETQLKTGDTYRLKVKGWKKIFFFFFNLVLSCMSCLYIWRLFVSCFVCYYFLPFWGLSFQLSYFCFHFHYPRKWVIENFAVIYIRECSAYILL